MEACLPSLWATHKTSAPVYLKVASSHPLTSLLWPSSVCGLSHSHSGFQEPLRTVPISVRALTLLISVPLPGMSPPALA